MPKLKIVELDREIDIPTGVRILQGSMAQGVTFGFICGGNAACGTCLVRVIEGIGTIGPRNQKEDFLAKAMMLESDYRLGCQTEMGAGDILVSIPSLSRGR